MASARRIVVIGAGHNGLVASYYLAKAGLAPLVIESRDVVGGIAVNEELQPGFRCPAVLHSAGPLLPRISSDLQLEKQGLTLIRPDVRIFAPSPNGHAIAIYDNPERTAQELGKISASDARSYPEFAKSFANIGRVMAPLLLLTPPDIKNPTAEDMWHFGKIGLKFRGLGKKDAFRLLRWGPMAVADLASEWFETETLRAVVAARGIFGAFAGPWSAGTSAGLILQAAIDGSPLAPAVFAKGGMGALTQALAKASSAAGTQFRTNACVKNVRIEAGRVSSVVLETGEEIPAKAVISNADPQSTFLNLIDPTELDPDFLLKVRNYRASGSAAKVNLALAGLPSFEGIKNGGSVLSGRIHVGPDIDYIERAFDVAKYGDFSTQPYMDVVIPSLADPSLAAKGGHVMSIHVQYAPYKLKNGDWKSRREEFGDVVVKALSNAAPDLPKLIVARQVLTPLDLEQRYGLSGGHILHGEPALDQLFAFRPILGWAQYRTPIQGLYLCGSGTHPGLPATGASGANASREVIRDLRNG